VTGDINAARNGRNINIFGCGLRHTIAKAPKAKHFSIWINLATPYMPITSDGKAPDLKPFLGEIAAAVRKAVKKAHRPSAGGKQSQKDIVLDNLDASIDQVSYDATNGQRFRFNERQVLYALRPIVMEETGESLPFSFARSLSSFPLNHPSSPKRGWRSSLPSTQSSRSGWLIMSWRTISSASGWRLSIALTWARCGSFCTSGLRWYFAIMSRYISAAGSPAEER
jgi:hypothetical protein